MSRGFYIRYLVLFFAVCTAMPACGSSRHSLPDDPIDFTYSVNGDRARVSSLRGRPLVLALVRTSELTSDLFIQELKKVHQQAAGKTRFLILSLDPNEEPMLTHYREFNEIPFEIGIADWNVARGASSLGPIPIVPTLYLIDKYGRVVDLSAGSVTSDRLLAELKRRRWF